MLALPYACVPMLFCGLMIMDVSMWTFSEARCQRIAKQACMHSAVSPVAVFTFNAKQLYVCLLQLRTALIRAQSVVASSQKISQQLVGQLLYLLGLIMTLHCFKSGIFTSSVFSSIRRAKSTLFTRLQFVSLTAMALGLGAFGYGTLLAEDIDPGRYGNDRNIAHDGVVWYVMAIFLLLSPELVADCCLLISGSDTQPRAALVSNEAGLRLTLLSDPGPQEVEVGVASDEVVAGTQLDTLACFMRVMVVYGVLVIGLALISSVQLESTIVSRPRL